MCHGFAAAVGKAGALVAGVVFNHVDDRGKVRHRCGQPRCEGQGATHAVCPLPPQFWISGICGAVGVIVTYLLIPDLTGLDLREGDKRWLAILAGEQDAYDGDAVRGGRWGSGRHSLDGVPRPAPPVACAPPCLPTRAASLPPSLPCPLPCARSTPSTCLSLSASSCATAEGTTLTRQTCPRSRRCPPAPSRLRPAMGRRRDGHLPPLAHCTKPHPPQPACLLSAYSLLPLSVPL